MTFFVAVKANILKRRSRKIWFFTFPSGLDICMVLFNLSRILSKILDRLHPKVWTSFLSVPHYKFHLRMEAMWFSSIEYPEYKSVLTNAPPLHLLLIFETSTCCVEISFFNLQQWIIAQQNDYQEMNFSICECETMETINFFFCLGLEDTFGARLVFCNKYFRLKILECEFKEERSSMEEVKSNASNSFP